MMLPWLTQPVMLHSSRDPGHCMMTPEQCAYKTRYWVYWYEADHRYALPTVALILSTILVFTIAHILNLVAPASWRKTSAWRRVAAASRGASYRRWKFGNWRTQSLGAYLLGFVGFVFFAVLTLAAQPYYWPNSRDGEISYGGSPPLATRAGWMALALLPFVIILPTKANPVAAMIGTSPENLIVWHNWLAWAMFVLALVHTFPFIVYRIWMGDIVTEWNTGGIWVTGVVALLAQAWLTFFSIRWLRERYYELFKATHFFAALVFVVFFFFHCDFRLTSWDYFIAVGVLYVSSWLYSQCRTYLEHGLGHTARLSLETDDMLRLTIDTNADWRPGQHVYLRFLHMGFHAFTSHPFTICSLPETRTNIESRKRNQMVFFVKARGGLTGRLASLARANPGTSVRVLLDGPYGGMQDRWFSGFDHTIIIGGGAGAGFTLGVAEDWLQRQKENPLRQRRMTLVVSSSDPGFRRWYLDELASITSTSHLEMGGVKGPDDVTDGSTPEKASWSVHVHHTGPQLASTASSASDDDPNKSGPVYQDKSANTQHVSVPGAELQVAQGRPDLLALGRRAVEGDGESIGLVVCGPVSMLHDVANVAASAQGGIVKGAAGPSEVWLHQESFSA